MNCNMGYCKRQSICDQEAYTIIKEASKDSNFLLQCGGSERIAFHGTMEPVISIVNTDSGKVDVKINYSKGMSPASPDTNQVGPLLGILFFLIELPQK